ncbi:MAG: phosphoglucosamine mutase [Bacteroidota bacterium]|nr:phosphoglucosamine mutase [Bacteroidota bacterium]
MTLIKSISGIRGTIGGRAGDGLSPADILKFTAGYAQWLKTRNPDKEILTVILGRDARISGEMVKQLISGTLLGMACNVIDIGMATTPTTEMAVTDRKADGGIIITASHNPRQWNALKLLKEDGEFLSAADGEQVLKNAEIPEIFNAINYAEVDRLGKLKKDYNQLTKHIQKITEIPYVDIDAIEKADFTVAIDCVNSVGGIAIPELLRVLGVENVIPLYIEPSGEFPHNPEPLPQNLTEISKLMIKKNADVGFVVDPDVDRLAIVNENGSMFGEEYTLVAVADYVLNMKKGNTASNLSSTRALRDITEKHGGKHVASAVGEVNVVAAMKENHAVIGGEGNGGIILPELHYGRDALIGIAIFLTHLAKSGKKCSELRKSYPEYFISKNKIELTPEVNVDAILHSMKEKYSSEKINDVDGVKIDFPESWVHLRKSNTEAIIRIYAEAKSESKANSMAENIIADIKKMIG